MWNGFKVPAVYCPETGKVCYDKVTARTAANARFAHDHTRLRLYPCPFCQRAGRPCWHLTSRTGDDYRRYGEGLHSREDDEL